MLPCSTIGTIWMSSSSGTHRQHAAVSTFAESRHRSFARDEKCDIEKEQALRLVRHLLSLERANGGTSARSFRHIPAAVVRALVAVAESQDEQLRLPALETLVEICAFICCRPPLPTA